jgi:hypothetical protein
MKTAGAHAVFAGILVLSSCAGASEPPDATATSEAEAEASAATEATTTEPETTEAGNDVERSQAVNEFLAAVELNANCTSSECSTAQAMYDRYENLYELAGEIPGDDIVGYVSVMSSAWDTWNDCLLSADTRFERFDCADASNMKQAVSDLSDALQ